MKLNLFMDWPEVLAFVLLVIGFFSALGSGSAVIAYTLVLLAGLMGGRIWFRVKKGFKTPWVIILTGFLIGFMLGSRYGSNKIILLFYVFGIAISYYLHDREIIKSLQY
ncbi:hypothetical protein CEE44_02965 [Candidatus Woesearchaeota archaeon B3_Woes]|nr:MAG: hypothetical protein CEE44_02965 [Candidatus Woesearchaeota archaeon B3_Woes]